MQLIPSSISFDKILLYNKKQYPNQIAKVQEKYSLPFFPTSSLQVTISNMDISRIIKSNQSYKKHANTMDPTLLLLLYHSMMQKIPSATEHLSTPSTTLNFPQSLNQIVFMEPMDQNSCRNFLKPQLKKLQLIYQFQ